MTDTFPMSLSFNISGVSPYTLYNVHAVATYRRTSCSQTMFHGEILSFTTECKYVLVQVFRKGMEETRL